MLTTYIHKPCRNQPSACCTTDLEDDCILSPHSAYVTVSLKAGSQSWGCVAMAGLEMHQIVDLERYPIDQLDSPRGASLVDSCRAALDDNALCALPGFVFPTVVAKMARQAEALLATSYRYDAPRMAYYPDGKEWPSDHPRAIEHSCRYHQALNYQIPNDSLVRTVYLWPQLSEFVRLVLGYETLFRSDCPHLALTVQFAGDGDQNGWHFDGNDAVFSLLLQEPSAGGAFEYAPYIRSSSEENYEAVARVVADPDTHAVRPPISAGTFTLFKGDLSLHRVAPVAGDRRRIIALFSYDREPGQVFPQYYIEELHGYQQGVCA